MLRSKATRKNSHASPPQKQADPRKSFVHVLPVIVLGLAVLVTFGRVCGHEFTNWDDGVNVVNNPRLYGQTLAGLGALWRHAYAGLYVPLTYTAWWLLARLAQVDSPEGIGAALNPYVFHTANLLLHVCATLFAYGLLKALTGKVWPSVAGALLFALHPLQVEPVAWVTGLKDVLCGSLSLLALWQYVVSSKFLARTQASDAHPPKFWGDWHYVLGSFALAAALLAKPSAVTVPILAGLIDWMILKRPVRQIAKALALWVVLVAACAWITLRVQPASDTNAGPILMRPLIVGHTLAFYLHKLVVPVPLAAVYPESIRQVLQTRWIWVTWLVPAAVLGLAVASWRRIPWFATALAIFVLAPLPVLGWIAFEYEDVSTVADRYEYVGIIGPAFALAFFLSHPKSRRFDRLGWIASCVALVTLGCISFVQCAYWADSRSLFLHNIAVFPDVSVGYCNLAADISSSGNLEEAVGLAQKAVRLDSNSQNNLTLGLILQKSGRHAEAGKAFLRAVEIEPRNLAAMAGLAVELARAGQQSRARAIGDFAVQNWPNNSRSHSCLSKVLLMDHQAAKSLAEAEAAVSLNPVDAVSRLALAESLEANGRQSEAATQYAIVLTLAPNDNDALAGFSRTGQAAH